MKKFANFMGALAFAVSTLAAVTPPSHADALAIDISRDKGDNTVAQPAPAHNNNNNNSHNNNQNTTQTTNAARMQTKLDTIFVNNGFVNFNYTITNIGNLPGSVTKIKYTGTLTMKNNSYPFDATGVVSNCSLAPNQSAHITVSFKDSRFGNYRGNVGSKGSTNTSWTTHR